VGLALGLATLAAIVPAGRGSRAGRLTVVARCVLSALLGIGAFFDDAAPTWAKVGVTVAMVLTALGVAMLAPLLRVRPAKVA
jgi:hypothetical protein